MGILRNIEARYLFIGSQGKATRIVVKLNHLRANLVCFPGTIMPINNLCPSISTFLISFSEIFFMTRSHGQSYPLMSFNVFFHFIIFPFC